MSAAEWWLLAAVVVAGVATLLYLAASPAVPPRLAPALHAAATALIAVGLLLALP